MSQCNCKIGLHRFNCSTAIKLNDWQSALYRLLPHYLLRKVFLVCTRLWAKHFINWLLKNWKNNISTRHWNSLGFKIKQWTKPALIPVTERKQKCFWGIAMLIRFGSDLWCYYLTDVGNHQPHKSILSEKNLLSVLLDVLVHNTTQFISFGEKSIPCPCLSNCLLATSTNISQSWDWCCLTPLSMMELSAPSSSLQVTPSWVVLLT